MKIMNIIPLILRGESEFVVKLSTESELKIIFDGTKDNRLQFRNFLDRYGNDKVIFIEAIKKNIICIYI